MTKPKVFISYSHTHEDWPRQLAKNMQDEGLDVWFDQFSIRAGQPLRESLEMGLRQSDVIVLLVGPESIKKPSVLFEIGAALAMNKTIIPVIPADLDLHQLPSPLRHIKAVIRKSPDDTAREIADAVGALRGEAA